jgi:hypothetical protein
LFTIGEESREKLIVHPKLFTIGEESREKLPAANGEQLCAARKIFCDHP